MAENQNTKVQEQDINQLLKVRRDILKRNIFLDRYFYKKKINYLKNIIVEN